MESVHKAEQRDHKKIEDVECEACKVYGKKSMVVKVKVVGEIDGGCDGKN